MQASNYQNVRPLWERKGFKYLTLATNYPVWFQSCL